MRKIEFDFQQELQQQIQILNSLYELTLKQKALLEEGDYENLFTTKSNFDEISQVIQKQRKKLSSFENNWNCDQSVISQSVRQRINELVDQLSELMKKVIITENKNYSMLQKIGEDVSEFYCEVL